MIASPRLNDFIEGIDGTNRRRAWRRFLISLPPGEIAAWEALLAIVPEAGWHPWKADILAQIDRHNPARGWAQAADLFNEARAYHHLAQVGCTDIEFARRSPAAPSPDLLARDGDAVIHCEVKTLHLGQAASPSPRLARKVQSRLEDAQRQLAGDGTTGIHPERRMIYLVLAGSAASVELTAWLKGAVPAGLEIVIDGNGR